MSPFLESWEHHKDCDACGTSLCFILDDRTGKKVPTESTGRDHRENPDCSKWVKKTFHRICQGDPPETFPAKPSHKTRALEYEVQHEGQKSLEDWCK